MGLGVDFGGTKIEAVWLAEDGSEHGRMRVPTPRGDYDASLRAVAELVARVEAAAGVRGAPVGVGIPGTIAPDSGLVRGGNATWLSGRAFDRDLAALLDRPVKVTNDANCFALSEALDGAGAGAPTVFGVILGTGVGGGLVIGGRLVEGANNVAGEWGHSPLPARSAEELDGPRCFCGRRGCLEVWLSGPAISADHARVLGLERAPAAPEIAAQAAAGDPAARATLDRHLDRLARSLGWVVNLIDPHVIVLGGGVSNMDHLYRDLAPRVLPHVMADRAHVEIRRARHGDSSGVRGAARLWELP
ncbi:MAG: ROK family protein [Alphaproteobacteria bacterium]|nr:MAG: ROK family protein [Alphaproteobacteria bacterium]